MYKVTKTDQKGMQQAAQQNELPVQKKSKQTSPYVTKEGQKPPILRQTGSPHQAKQRPVQRKESNELKGIMSSQYGVDLSGYKEHQDSSFPGSVGALATIQGKDIHYAPGQYTEKNRKHELGHAIDNTLNGMPKGDKVVNGQSVNTTREKAADKIADAPLQRKPFLQGETQVTPNFIQAIQRTGDKDKDKKEEKKLFRAKGSGDNKGGLFKAKGSSTSSTSGIMGRGTTTTAGISQRLLDRIEAQAPEIAAFHEAEKGGRCTLYFDSVTIDGEACTVGINIHESGEPGSCWIRGKSGDLALPSASHFAKKAKEDKRVQAYLHGKVKCRGNNFGGWRDGGGGSPPPAGGSGGITV